MTLPHTTAAARLAAKLLAHRQTPHDEVPELIRNVHGALLRLGQPEETIAEAEVTSMEERQGRAAAAGHRRYRLRGARHDGVRHQPALQGLRRRGDAPACRCGSSTA